MTYETIEVKDGDNVHVLYGMLWVPGDGVASVNIDDHGIIEGVPVFYHCEGAETVGGMPFYGGERVIIVNHGDATTLSAADMEIIGFEDGLPRPCVCDYGDNGWWRDTGSFTNNDYRNYFGYRFGVHYHSWFTFNNVQVSQGQSVSSAKVTFIPTGSAVAAPSLKIYGNSDVSPINPTTFAEAEALPLTSAVAWTPGVWTYEVAEDTPDIKTIIQGIVNKPTWVKGGSIMIIVKSVGTVGERRGVYGCYDGIDATDNLLQAQLSITT